MYLVNKTYSEELAELFVESDFAFGYFIREFIREDISFEKEVLFVFWEFGVFAEVDLVAIGHFLLGDCDGDDDLDDGLSGRLLHLIYNDNLMI